MSAVGIKTHLPPVLKKKEKKEANLVIFIVALVACPFIISSIESEQLYFWNGMFLLTIQLDVSGKRMIVLNSEFFFSLSALDA